MSFAILLFRLSFIITVLYTNLMIFCAHPQQQMEGYDLVFAQPHNMDGTFATLQQEVIRALGATARRQQGLFNINISNSGYNLSLNHRENDPMRPHISLKALPLDAINYQQAKNVLTSGRINDALRQNQPQTIRLNGLLAIRGIKDPNKLFIVVDFADEPSGSFNRLANTLDKLTGIPYQEQFLQHITLARIWPFSSAPQNISDAEVQGIQAVLTNLTRTLRAQGILPKQFPIDAINYSFWSDKGPKRIQQLLLTEQTEPAERVAPQSSAISRGNDARLLQREIETLQQELSIATAREQIGKIQRIQEHISQLIQRVNAEQLNTTEKNKLLQQLYDLKAIAKATLE